MTSTLTPTAVDSGILLEAGTNEVEILVFNVAGRRCGVNVAKVREVRTHQAPIVLPLAPRAMSGVVRVRDAVVPLVNLRQLLWGLADDPGTDQTDEHLFLEFNNQMLAFRVQGVDRIYRISWKSLIPLPHCPGMNAPVTGVVLLGGQIVTILDFEAIAGFMGMNGTPPTAADPTIVSDALISHPPIVFADDSTLIRRMIDDALLQAGYQCRHGFADGQEAWEYLDQLATRHTTESIHEEVAVVISDIEMPRMDGLTLTRRIREHAVLKNIPVVLFSSLISPDNEKKGRQVGATAQISKPHWEGLTSTLMEVLAKLAGDGHPVSVPA